MYFLECEPHFCTVTFDQHGRVSWNGPWRKFVQKDPKRGKLSGRLSEMVYVFLFQTQQSYWILLFHRAFRSSSLAWREQGRRSVCSRERALLCWLRSVIGISYDGIIYAQGLGRESFQLGRRKMEQALWSVCWLVGLFLRQKDRLIGVYNILLHYLSMRIEDSLQWWKGYINDC